ncbi:MAG: nitroreductase family deazaflavin-dependent oxidoreductase [Actinomycetota bacterium]|nr:nitroreductase family deazaflavin-dependent oxidoreductase [Actinomycetota bacterium]
MGISLAGSRKLTVRGRKSGEPRTTPVNPLDLDGETFLVAPRGTTQWVKNLRAVNEGELQIGRKTRRFRGDEIADADKLPILKAYLEKWAWEVGKFFELPKDPSDEQIKEIAPLHPIFRVDYIDPKA